MYPQINIKHNVGNTIDIPNQLDIKSTTYVSSNVASGVTTVPVDNAGDFTAGSILLLMSSIGAENSEIVASSSHTGQALTTAETALPHNRGETASEIKYDQIAVHKSTTIDGTYSEFSKKTFFTTQQSTIFYDNTGAKSDYYKVRWENSANSETSDFSSPISVTAYPENSVAKVVYPVLTAMGVSGNDTKITVPFCLSAIDDARKFTAGKLFGIRHAWQQEFEHPIKLLAGTNSVSLPSNIDFKDTDRSLLAARLLIGNVLAPYNMRYIDKRTWNQISTTTQGGDNTASVSIGGTTITLDNAGDFPDTDSGVAYVATEAYSESIMQIAYTGVNAATNQLTGVTGVTRAMAVGTRVWSRPQISQPIHYTVYEDKIVFDRIVPDSMQGDNLYIDFYKKIPEVEDLYQVLDEPYREIYKWYLRYAIKYRKDIDLPSNDPDLVKFESLVGSLVQNLYTGQDTTIITN